MNKPPPVSRAVSAPATTQASEVVKNTRFRRAGRAVKASVADFFGLGDEAPEQSARWKNRRCRYYRGKLKDDVMPATPDVDELDSSQTRHIHDPLRLQRKTEMPFQRTNLLSSTSTYARSFKGLPQHRLRKDSVFKMTLKGITTVAKARKNFRTKPSVHSRSYAPASLQAGEVDELSGSFSPFLHDDAYSLVDDVFFDESPGPPESGKLGSIREDMQPFSKLPPIGRRRPAPMPYPSTAEDDLGDELDMPDFSMRRITNNVMHTIMEGRHQVGMGFMGRLLQRRFRSDRMNSDVKTQIDEMDDHRPFFTWWVTFVQILVFIVAVTVYGIAPIGSGETVHEELVMKPDLRIEKTSFIEIENLWIGPRRQDLIHLGAKYSPCMRLDENLQKVLALDAAAERSSGCCVRDDGSGCSQMVKSRCMNTMSSFIKWTTESPGPNDQTAGTVCGQDPRYCKKPISVAPFEWNADDITEWPLCLDTQTPNITRASKEDRHMTCEILGRPCCHGIQGECMITTREHCDFMRGFYYQDAYLCSQVNCMNQICGMITFSNPDKPDQFYRLWTSLFLHGGLVHLMITIGFQMLVMRDIEKLTGCIRMAIIYMGSGIAGNLASSIFLPYQVEVGPAGSQFGILACLLVEVLQSCPMLKRPVIEFLKVGCFILVLFLLGLLPWIDNWAHLSGFLFGFLLAFSLLPYVSFGKFDFRRKCISIFVSLGGAIILFFLLIILFYVLTLNNCPGCQYFNCIPLTSNFCKNMEISLERNTTYNDW